MQAEGIIDVERRLLADLYWKRPVALVRGEGEYVWDADGKRYVDCSTGYGVALLGHRHPRVVEAIKRQADRLLTCHGSFYNDVRAEYLEKLYKCLPSRLCKFFFSNSGAEAVEAAMKIAAKFTGRSRFIAMVNSFHGKTLGALSLTHSLKYRGPFKGLINSNVTFVPYGRAEGVREAIANDVAAVFVEPVQGEGGVRVPPSDFLREVREACDEEGALLAIDEVQTGFGRTGRLWAFQHWGVEPDILCLGKSIAGGVPIGLTVAREDVMGALSRGEHSNTFGGNPLAVAAASAALDALIEERLVERASEMGRLAMERMREMKGKFRVIRDVRGLGLMLGVESRFEVDEVILGALRRGVIVLEAGRNVVRLLPPLVISRGSLTRVFDVLEELFEAEEGKLDRRARAS